VGRGTFAERSRPGRGPTPAADRRIADPGWSWRPTPIRRPERRRRSHGPRSEHHQARGVQQRAATCPVVRARESAKRTVAHAMKCEGKHSVPGVTPEPSDTYRRRIGQHSRRRCCTIAPYETTTRHTSAARLPVDAGTSGRSNISSSSTRGALPGTSLRRVPAAIERREIPRCVKQLWCPMPEPVWPNRLAAAST
jgi:hypothetical protein